VIDVTVVQSWDIPNFKSIKGLLQLVHFY
jgi:hypothetical protein